MKRATILLAAALATAAAGAAPPLPATTAAVATDPAPDAAHPAALAAVRLPSHGALLNAVLYRAAGGERHPTMLLLHGLPGNEQNLDLAQAVRRAGWNVLTFHYRGSWGSPGTFSFAHCGEDAAAALAWLRDPANAARYGINPDRIVVAGHSMGGTMAAEVAAADDAVAGTLLIDPADFAAIGRSFADPAKRDAFRHGEIEGDVAPLATTADALMAETAQAGAPLDLVVQARRLADRPLLVIGASRGIGAMGMAAAEAARASGGHWVEATTMPTDHSFSDHRIALATAVIAWLRTVPPRAVSFTGPGWRADNVFARIIRGELPVAKVYEDARVLAFMDNHPESVGHVLVISKVAHARNVMEMPQAELDRVMAVARRIAIAERAAFHPTGIVLQQNNGNASSVPHLHVHVLPAYGLVPSLSTPAPLVDVAALEPIAAKIRAALPR